MQLKLEGVHIRCGAYIGFQINFNIANCEAPSPKDFIEFISVQPIHGVIPVRQDRPGRFGILHQARNDGATVDIWWRNLRDERANEYRIRYEGSAQIRKAIGLITSRNLIDSIESTDFGDVQVDDTMREQVRRQLLTYLTALESPSWGIDEGDRDLDSHINPGISSVSPNATISKSTNYFWPFLKLWSALSFAGQGLFSFLQSIMGKQKSLAEHPQNIVRQPDQGESIISPSISRRLQAAANNQAASLPAKMDSEKEKFNREKQELARERAEFEREKAKVASEKLAAQALADRARAKLAQLDAPPPPYSVTAPTHG